MSKDFIIFICLNMWKKCKSLSRKKVRQKTTLFFKDLPLQTSNKDNIEIQLRRAVFRVRRTKEGGEKILRGQQTQSHFPQRNAWKGVYHDMMASERIEREWPLYLNECKRKNWTGNMIDEISLNITTKKSQTLTEQNYYNSIFKSRLSWNP